MRVLYSLLMYLLTPAALLYLALRSLRDAGYRRRWLERFALAGPSGFQHCIHVHAASVGEVNAASPLVDALLRDHPSERILVSTFTPTGSRHARQLWGDRVGHVYIPLDLPGAVARFYQYFSPALVVIMETEIWPNLYHGAAQRGIPLVMANARLSDRSVPRYNRFRSLITGTLACARAILVQGQADAERFAHCGAPADRLRVTGNLKFDVSISPAHFETGELLRAGWGHHRTVLTAGSTHEDDERALLAAFTQQLNQFPGALLIIVPRHPERFARAAQLAREAGLNVSLFSEGRHVAPDSNCLVVDAMGELLNYYAAADLAFVGGTMADIGGHNILEPAALGRAVLVGPETANVADICTAMVAAGAALQLESSAGLPGALDRLLGDGGLRDRMGQAGVALVEQGRGALGNTLTTIESLMDHEAPRSPSG